MNLFKKTLGFCIFLSIVCSGIVFSQGKWSAVGSGLNAQAVTMAEYNGNLYIGKLNFAFADEINKWDGTKLSGVGGGINGPVGALLVFNNELYAGGGFTAAGNTAASDVAKWDGNKWTAVGDQLDNFSILALAAYKGELYAAGYGVDGTGANSAALTIAKWDGTNWVDVGGGISGGDVYSLTVYNNELYASGTFTKAGNITATHIAKWDGTNWSAVGTGPTIGSVIYTVNAYGGELYAGGNFSKIGGIATNCLAKWNGTSWSKVGTTGNGTDNTVIALTQYNGDLYIGGAFSTAGGVAANHIVKWNGTSWSTLGNGIGTAHNPNEQVWYITPYMNSVYAVGAFATANGVTVNNIAKWTTDQANSNITQSTNTLNFGAHTPSGDSMLTVTFHNLSGKSVSIDSALISGTDKTDFGITSNTKGVTFPYTLVTGDSIGFTVTYTAGPNPKNEQALLTLYYAGSRDSNRTVNVTGTSVALSRGNIQSSVNKLNFGAHFPNTDSTLIVTFHNSSGKSVSIDSAYLTGVNKADFAIMSNTKGVSFPYDLTDKDSIGFNIQFTANLPAHSSSAQLIVRFAEDSSRLVTLTGSSKANANVNEVSVESPLIAISPNPTTGTINIHHATDNLLSVTVLNLLGEPLMDLKRLHDQDFTVDLSQLVPGTYYIKFTSANSVVTKMVVRE